MSFFNFRGHAAPVINDAFLNPTRLGQDEARRAALAFAIGERLPTTDPPRGRRISPADLPDVDWSRAVAVRKPTRLQRFARLLGLAKALPEPAPDEWRVLRNVSDRPAPVRHEGKVISINRAA